MAEKESYTYHSFPPFQQWAQVPFDAARWEQTIRRLQRLPSDSFTQLQRRVQRLAAIETGVIELLYPAQPQLTAAVGNDVAWEAALAQNDAYVAALVRSHLRSDQEVQNAVQETFPVNEA